MSIRSVTWKEMVRDWRDNPEKLLAFIEGLLWEAKIDPDSDAVWLGKEGKIVLYDQKVWFEEAKKEGQKK